MSTTRIAVITDSGTDTPLNYVEKYHIYRIPLNIIFSDGVFTSGITISTEECIERFDKEIPSTSLPSPEEILQVFKQVQTDGFKQALFVGISSGLSATFETCRMVASQMEDFEVKFIDTKSIGIGGGMAVVRAAQLLDEGVELDRVIELVEEEVKAHRIFFVTKTLDFLRKGGRINEATYRLGQFLNIKPIITCTKDKGTYAPVKKPRGWEKALKTIMDMSADAAREWPRVLIGISCTKSNDVYQQIVDGMKERLVNNDIVEIVHTTLTPELVTHTGPSLVGITVHPYLEA